MLVRKWTEIDYTTRFIEKRFLSSSERVWGRGIIISNRDRHSVSLTVNFFIFLTMPRNVPEIDVARDLMRKNGRLNPIGSVSYTYVCSVFQHAGADGTA